MSEVMQQGDVMKLSAQASKLSEALIHTPHHALLLRFNERGLHASRLVSAGAQLKDAYVYPQHRAVLEATERWLKCYFEHQSAPLPPLEFSALRPFRQRVLTALMGVGFGQLITYRGLAERVGSPKASRAVGCAMASNPLPLIIPCHRVIQSSGALGAYSGYGGVETKRLLVEYEAQERTFVEYLSHQRRAEA